MPTSDNVPAAVTGVTAADFRFDASEAGVSFAILADRLDVSEEIDRFRSHIAAFRNALKAGDSEPVGKRLGFLAQELGRERFGHSRRP